MMQLNLIKQRAILLTRLKMPESTANIVCESLSLRASLFMLQRSGMVCFSSCISPKYYVQQSFLSSCLLKKGLFGGGAIIMHY